MRAAPADQHARPLKVVHVIARMNVGGPAHQVVQLCAGLGPPRYDVTVLSGNVEEDEADYRTLVGGAPEVEVIAGLGRSVKAWSDVQALLGLVAAIRRHRPDIVHTHTAKAGVLGRIAARLCRVPAVVHTYHGHLLHGYFSPRGTRMVRTVERVLARGTTRIVTIGAQVRDDLLKAGIGRPEQYVVMAPGVEAPVAIEQVKAREMLGLPPRVPVVAFVGRLTDIKRPDRFLAVATRVLAVRSDVVFLVVGEGNLAESVRASAIPLGERMVLLGWQRDVAPVYAASDLVVLTSDNEGMPVTLIEAALMGRPAVATDVGSVREVVVDGETGLVRSCSTEQLVEAVLALVDDPALREELGEAAAARAVSTFSVNRMVTATAELYSNLTQPRAHRRQTRKQD
jgi:glycosyltransferase involved in cell wall biosynthesis